jgi:hypothetical protein
LSCWALLSARLRFTPERDERVDAVQHRGVEREVGDVP